jgi:hypothetical protein
VPFGRAPRQHRPAFMLLRHDEGGAGFTLGVLCDILRPLSVATASVPSPPKPRTGDTAGGAGSREAHGPQRCGNSDALLAPESQSFLDNVIAGFRHS